MDKEQNRLWTVPFILVLFVNALNGISSYMVNPAMPEFLVSKGIPFALTGLISSLLSWVALAMRPFSGAMSDRFNKKKIMFVSYLATAACMLGYALVQKSAAVIGVRILHGVAFAVSGTISMVFATSFVPEKKNCRRHQLHRHRLTVGNDDRSAVRQLNQSAARDAESVSDGWRFVFDLSVDDRRYSLSVC